MNNKGLLFIFSGPAGAGKTTYAKMLCDRNNNCIMSVSATTRKPRSNEKNGKDYFFLSKKDFEKKIAGKDFAEYAEFSNNYYGTPKEFLNKNLVRGIDVILDIEVQGAAQIKGNYPDAVMIFLLPPSPEILIERLKERRTEELVELRRRMEIARNEIQQLGTYDYFLINDDLEKTFAEINEILAAEHCRIRGGECEAWLQNRNPEDVLKV